MLFQWGRSRVETIAFVVKVAKASKQRKKHQYAHHNQSDLYHLTLIKF